MFAQTQHAKYLAGCKTCTVSTSTNSTKGQLISKCLFGIFNSSKKRTKKIDLITMLPQVVIVFVRFLEEFEDTKKKFRN